MCQGVLWPSPRTAAREQEGGGPADWPSVCLILQACSKHAECWEGAGAGRASEQSLGARCLVHRSGAAVCRLLLSRFFVLSKVLQHTESKTTRRRRQHAQWSFHYATGRAQALAQLQATRGYAVKEVRFGVDCRSAVLAGVDKLADAVQVTLGPKVRPWPRRICLQDVIKNMHIL